jgi:formylmethanofuran dehydrogenase subunit E-like metal-binding protein
MALHAPQTIKTTSTQDLDPLSLANNDHLFQSLVSHYTDTHFYILSLALALLL